MKTGRTLTSIFILIFILLFPSFVLSETPVQLDVKIILASDKASTVDSRLENLIRELKTVFRYSSYQLLGQDRLRLIFNSTGNVTLPENRLMKITPKGVSGDRVILELEILKNKSQIFQTVIKLKNKSSITIGGPEYQGGNLLFNIFTSF